MPFRLLLCLLAVAFALSASSLAHAQATPEELFKEGREAVQKKDWQRARDLLLKSWALKKSFDTAALLGQSELKLAKYRDAAEHLDFALRNFPNLEPTADAKKRIEDGARTARSKVFALTIEVSVADAEVTIDSAPAGRSPLASEVFLDPGNHVVEAKLDGHEPGKREVRAEAGVADTIRLELVKQTGAAPAAAAPSSASEPGGSPPAGSDTTSGERSGTKTALLVTGTALTVVSLGVGIGFGLDSRAASSDADDLSSKLGTNGCSGGANAAECSSLKDTRDRANRNATIATVGFIGAGVFGAATAAIWFAWPTTKPSPENARAIRVSPWLAERGGLSVHGQF
ncbi:MAG: PEGA domain-containing protein [Polyangiaceae bacterium]|nr:PEGA domain-containing protein [Polyangiaceae bacterium]MCL4756374.1 PEGA domain-containing protein [Myxococcales bacterium]